MIVNELAPDTVRSVLGCFVQMAIALGIFVIYAFSLGFTESTDREEISQSFLWRFAVAFPTILAIIQVLLLIFVFPYESPQYYLSVNQVCYLSSEIARQSNGDTEEAVRRCRGCQEPLRVPHLSREKNRKKQQDRNQSLRKV
eukprot:TRINITY_DN12932_c0_g3_i8.p1 TRINITY_DN12932_c0_g3~~TRINITY_DN12932_c0_g3_i8.p1  ORF type:complete len:142 (+),score=12.16 TRINITY_DN12932_c0_g3_i8:826-1251(+)